MKISIALYNKGQSQEISMVSIERDLKTLQDVKYIDYLRRKMPLEYIRLIKFSENLQVNKRFKWDGSKNLIKIPLPLAKSTVIRWESSLYLNYKNFVKSTGITTSYPVSIKIFIIIHWLRLTYSLPSGVLDYDAVLKSLLLEDNGYIAEVTLENPGSRNKTFRFLQQLFGVNFRITTPQTKEILVYMLPQVLYLILLKNLDSDLLKIKERIKILKVEYRSLKRSKDIAALGVLELLEDNLKDLFYMLKEQQSKIKKLLSKKIKINLNATRFRLCSRVYTGYDTEFETKEYSVNEIVSAQAVSVTTVGVTILNSVFDNDYTDISWKTGSVNTLNITQYKDLFDVVSSLSRWLKPQEEAVEIFRDNLEKIVLKNLLLKSVKSQVTYWLPINNENNDYTNKSQMLRKITAGAQYKISNLFTDIVESINLNSQQKFEKRYTEFINLIETHYFTGTTIQTSLYSQTTEISEVYNRISDYHKAEVKRLRDLNKKKMKLTKIDSFKNILFNKVIRKISGGCEMVLLGHFNVADITILSDYSDDRNEVGFKREFDILRGSLASIIKPYVYKLKNGNLKVTLRDTIHLADPRTSLASLGKIYSIEKYSLKGEKEIGYKAIENIRRYSIEYPESFKNYAIRDAEIALKHGLTVQSLALEDTGELYMPVTLSSIVKRTLLKKWDEIGIGNFNYLPGNYKISDFRKLYTPRGIQQHKDIVIALPYFLAAYRGGRNESYMIGIDKEINWADYDLSGAYPTVISTLGVPYYEKVMEVTNQEFLKDYFSGKINILGNIQRRIPKLKMEKGNLNNYENNLYLNSYSVFNVDFKFPPTVKFPCIPVTASDSITIYPLTGTNETVTKYELKLALEIGCEVKMHKGYVVPYKYKIKDSEVEFIEKPYYSIYKKWIVERSKYEKGTSINLLTKLKLNSGYGSTGVGLNLKKTFDTRTGCTVENNAGELANPFIAQAIPAIVRAVVTEVIEKIHQSGRDKVLSVTTDGFLTTSQDILTSQEITSGKLSMELKTARKNLTGSETIFELVESGVGIISITTRGQLSIGGTRLGAITGFQLKNYTKENVEKILTEKILSNDRSISFISKTLRKGNEIYKKGGSVTPKYSERNFSINHSGGRIIVEPDLIEKYGNDYSNYLKNNVGGISLLDSKPHKDISIPLLIRHMRIINKPVYSGIGTPRSSVKLDTVKPGDYKLFLLKIFLRGYYSHNLSDTTLTAVKLQPLLESCGIKISNRQIHSWKRGIYYPSTVPATTSNKELVKMLQEKIPDLKMENFLVK